MCAHGHAAAACISRTTACACSEALYICQCCCLIGLCSPHLLDQALDGVDGDGEPNATGRALAGGVCRCIDKQQRMPSEPQHSCTVSVLAATHQQRDHALGTQHHACKQRQHKGCSNNTLAVLHLQQAYTAGSCCEQRTCDGCVDADDASSTVQQHPSTAVSLMRCERVQGRRLAAWRALHVPSLFQMQGEVCQLAGC